MIDFELDSIFEDNTILAMGMEELETFGHIGQDYIDNPSLTHPYPTAFKHFQKTIGLEPNVSHLLSCGENRFDLISNDLDNVQRSYASRFYDWLLENDYWEGSGDWEFVVMGETEPTTNNEVLEPVLFTFLESNWCDTKSHPLYPLLRKERPTVVFEMRRRRYNNFKMAASKLGLSEQQFQDNLEAYAAQNYDWDSAPDEITSYSGFVNWDIQIID